MPLYTKLYGVFLAVLVLFYYAGDVFRLRFLRSSRYRETVLLLGSLLFYSYANLRFLPVLLYEGTAAWAGGRIAGRRASRNPSGEGRTRGAAAAAVVSIAVLLAPLLLCRGFAAWAAFAGSADDLILPMGISFFSLQAVSYLADVAKGNIKAEKNLLTVLLFVSFFPCVSSGPILRMGDVAEQFQEEKRRFRYEDAAEGLRLWGWGLLKKLVAADNLCAYIAAVRSSENASGTALFLTVILYSFQLYFDFSGYSDIAIGSARLFGIRLKPNFAHPYLSAGIGEFWRRWHISLSGWLRDYVYIPLGGSRKGRLRTYGNLLLTFAVSGLWHGAGLTFWIWGLLHGAAVCGERALSGIRRGNAAGKPPRGGRVLVFCFVSFAWIFFSASGMAEAGRLLSSVLRMPGEFAAAWQAASLGAGAAAASGEGAAGGRAFLQLLSIPENGMRNLCIGTAAAAFLSFLEEFCEHRGQSGTAIVSCMKGPARWACYYAVISAVLFLNAGASANFIYNRF